MRITLYLTQRDFEKYLKGEDVRARLFSLPDRMAVTVHESSVYDIVFPYATLRGRGNG